MDTPKCPFVPAQTTIPWTTFPCGYGSTRTRRTAARGHNSKLEAPPQQTLCSIGRCFILCSFFSLFFWLLAMRLSADPLSVFQVLATPPVGSTASRKRPQFSTMRSAVIIILSRLASSGRAMESHQQHLPLRAVLQLARASALACSFIHCYGFLFMTSNY